MAREFVPLDVSDAPELERLAEAVQSSGKPYALKRGDQTLAVIRPVRRKQGKAIKTTRRRTTRSLQPDDALFRLIGIGASGRSDVSANKRKYLAEAYRAKTS